MYFRKMSVHLFIKHLLRTVLPDVLHYYIKEIVLNATRIYNKLRGNVYLPKTRDMIHIEPTSYCNLNCEFCAYGVKETPKKNVKLHDFIMRVDDATRSGYSHIGLTPITGDIFMDKGVLEKIQYLEDNESVNSYHFYTNGILMDKAKIDYLMSCKKLSALHISIYGHDMESFIHLTNGTKSEYQMLLKNLNYLMTVPMSIINDRIFLNQRVDSRFSKRNNTHESNLYSISSLLSDRLNHKLNVTSNFNNWGGLIQQSRIKPFIKVNNHKVFKHGVCKLILSKNQIMTDGVVNACACRDANATLEIGNVKENSLDDILDTTTSTPYKQLILQQQRGDFNEICKHCDFYESIYDKSDDIERNDKLINLINS